ncbi:hypothetical protein [Paractinoplanes abujensis]|uniref:RNA polymerase alpha subunit C-terminal domain-containing protein n=1 Tax=Paractinoplanes abujensis TaxID=882441 RepID=A0A7W7CQC2_9ACTN|nr:hypothetical protein [Actinoplanes abujensis]MBB4692791.1 hypothetical protein [Actinoplanes abujensis]
MLPHSAVIPAVFLAGDDARATAGVAAFIESLGLRPRDVGALTMAHWLEGMGLITMGLAGHGVGHWNVALGVDEFTGRAVSGRPAELAERYPCGRPSRLSGIRAAGRAGGVGDLQPPACAQLGGMQIRPAELAAIRAGDIDLAFRRWDRPMVKVGTRMRTAVGLVEITSVDRVPVSRLTAGDARRAGAVSLAALRLGLERVHPERPVYRIGLRYAGADPRQALREAVPDAAEIEAIGAWLDRLDRASPSGPWTRATLVLIDELPATRAPELAGRMGRETLSFKQNVRKLKERGLTQSLDIGYRLSPRGAAVLDHEGHPRAAGGTTEPEPGVPLPHLGAAATRALTARGVTRLEQVAALTAAEVQALHGVGPYALSRLRAALDVAGLTFRDETPTSGAG